MDFSDFQLILGKSDQDEAFIRFMSSRSPDDDAGGFGSYSYASFRREGFNLVYDKKKDYLKSVHLYSDGYEGFSEFKGELPAKASFSDKREDVRAKLGVPSQEGRMSGPSGLEASWAFYECAPFTYHFQFSLNGPLVLVTLGLSKADERLDALDTA